MRYLFFSPSPPLGTILPLSCLLLSSQCCTMMRMISQQSENKTKFSDYATLQQSPSLPLTPLPLSLSVSLPAPLPICISSLIMQIMRDSKIFSVSQSLLSNCQLSHIHTHELTHTHTWSHSRICQCFLFVCGFVSFVFGAHRQHQRSSLGHLLVSVPFSGPVRSLFGVCSGPVVAIIVIYY